MNLQPVTLEGRYVRLEPLNRSHQTGLISVGLAPRLWEFTPHRATTPEEMRRYIESTLTAQGAGRELAFVQIATDSNLVAGSTRYMNIDLANRKLEIGSTWLATPWQRTAINTEAKYLLLRHAFETVGCIRVEFKTDALNHHSRAAILRLGAKEEGTLRQHMITWDGRVRDTVYYSILDNEWSSVKKGLEVMLRRGSSGS